MGFTIRRMVRNPSTPANKTAAEFAIRIRHRDAVMDSTAALLVESASSSLTRIHSPAAVSNRSPMSSVSASRNRAPASSERPAAASAMTWFARFSQTRYWVR